MWEWSRWMRKGRRTDDQEPGRVRVRTRAGGSRYSPESFDGESGAFPPGGAATFRRMQRDPQIRACLTTKKMCVMAENVEVRPASGEGAAGRRAERAATVVEEAISSLPGGVCCLVEGALDARPMGYAVGELVWGADGSLERVSWHDPLRFVFHGDDFGQVGALEVVDARGGEARQIPRERFIVWSYQPRYGNPYGESDLLAAYRPWVLKDAALRYWATALDRFGSPILIGTLPPQATQQDSDDLLRTMQQLHQDRTVILPDATRIDPLLAAGSGPGQSYETAMDFCNREIAKAILGQTLTTEPGDSGSYGLGRVHHDIFGKWVAALRRELGALVLTEQVARPLTTMLLGPDYPPPTVTLPTLNAEELGARRELVLSLVAGKVVAPDEAWLRAYLGIPDRYATVL